MYADDAILLRQWQRHRDADAFAAIAARHGGMVFATCRRILQNAADAEDVAQECFVDLARSEVRIRSSLAAWLYVTAVHRSLNRVRGERRRLAREKAYAQSAQVLEPNSDDILGLVDEILLVLPERYRAPLVAHFFEGQSYETVAAQLRIPRSTAAHRVQKGVELIRRGLREKGMAVPAAALTTALAVPAAQAAPLSLARTLMKFALAGTTGSTQAVTIAAGMAGGLALMKTKVTIAVAIIAIVAVVLFGLRQLPSWNAPPAAPVPPVTFADDELTGPAEAEDSNEPVADAVPPDATVAADLELSDVALTQRGTIAGCVHTIEGDTVSGLAVRAIAAESASRRGLRPPPPVETVSDANGDFLYENLPFASYTVVAENESGAAVEMARVEPLAPYDDVTLVLKAGLPIAGKVLSGGAAVSGASLAAFVHAGKETSWAQRDAYFQQTNDEGTFRFDSLAAGAWEFWVAAEGSAPMLAPPIKAGTMDAAIELAPGAMVAGRVTDAPTGVPLSGLRVTAHQEGWRIPPEFATSAVDGGFTFSSLAPARYLFNVEDTERVLQSGPVALEVRPVNNPPLELRLAEGGIARGRFVDAGTGEGIAEAVARAFPRDKRMARRESAPSDTDGSFEIRGLGVGDYALGAADIPGYTHSRTITGPLTIHVTPGQVTEGIELPFERGIRVSGRVVYQDGRAVAGANIIGRADEAAWLVYAESGQDGRFELAGLTRAAPVHIEARTQHMQNANMGPFDIPEDGGGDLQIVLDLPRDGLIAGRVVDQRGRPISTEIHATHDDSIALATPFRYTTGADGRFVLLHLAPGDWHLAAYRNQRDLPLARQTVQPGQAIRNLRLVLNVSELTISGRVTDSAGNPVRARMLVDGPMVFGRPAPRSEQSITTSPGGAYEAVNLERGAYHVQATAEGYQPQWKHDIAAGSTGVDFVLEPLARVSGRVADPRGRPVTSYQIDDKRSHNPPMPGQTLRQVSDPQGRFDLEVEAGMCVLMVRAPGFRPEEFEVGFLPQTPSEDLLLTLQPSDRMARGVITDVAGAPVAGAEVYAVSPGTPWLFGAQSWRGLTHTYPQNWTPGQPDAVSASDGQFEIAPLDDEAVLLIAYHRTAGYSAFDVVSSAQETLDIRIPLIPGGGLEGVVTMYGEPLSGVKVWFVSDYFWIVTADTDVNGRYKFGAVAPGPGEVRVQPLGREPSFEAQTTPVDVASGRMQRLDFDLVPK